jgi:hypothetical protein
MTKMNEEDESIYWNASAAWAKYNPKWLIELVDFGKRGEKVFCVGDMRLAYTDGFAAGVTFFLTKEIPEVRDGQS